MEEKILVVDDDPDIARFVELNLRTHGYQTHVAADGVEALDKAFEVRPDLVLLDVTMPKMDGFEVAQRLRADQRTSNVSIIMLTARALSVDKVLGLTAGADDYVIKPCDPIELVARVKGTLRRAREMKALSPLTGLPGNVRIQEELQLLIREGKPFALLYADLDNFKAYNDHYGFLRGDEALRFTARALQESAMEIAGEGAFVGHVGGDDFVIICPPEHAEPICEMTVEKFDRAVPDLYEKEDRERGYIEIENRRKEVEQFPLMSISIGVATTDRRTFTHHGEAVTVAGELKEFAKKTKGSAFAVDRRG
jgi:diguanylate cyclase (GGDEF)-like protein